MKYIIRHIEIHNKSKLRIIILKIKHYIRYPYSKEACKGKEKIIYYVYDLYQQFFDGFSKKKDKSKSILSLNEFRELITSSSKSISNN